MLIKAIGKKSNKIPYEQYIKDNVKFLIHFKLSKLNDTSDVEI